jgi:solute carrier family 45 protein 1/2/4
MEVNRMGNSQYRRLPTTTPIELSSPSTPFTPSLRAPLEDASSGELAGLYFGILNIYNTLPQFIGTFISMIVFAILEPGKSPELSDAHPSEHHSTGGPNAISVCLFIGAISSIGAAYATKRLKDMY